MEHPPTIKETRLGDADYPSLLREISAPPQTLFYRGALPASSLPLLALVGTRKATRDGTLLARRIACELAKRGFGIVSGLAFGIDAAAHEGTLDAKGKTFAVLANGLDTIYPSHHERLALKILEEGGGLFSEYPLRTPALPHHFLERNRIVSGLAIATIIIEAPLHSGALVTARLAAEQGRDVLVFPGPAGHTHYAGSHHLVRTGARLVASLHDILEDLQAELPLIPADSDTLIPSCDALPEDERQLFTILQESVSGCTLDQLVVLTGEEPWSINQKLTPLILKGLVEEKSGGVFSVSRKL